MRAAVVFCILAICGQLMGTGAQLVPVMQYLGNNGGSTLNSIAIVSSSIGVLFLSIFAPMMYIFMDAFRVDRKRLMLLRVSMIATANANLFMLLVVVPWGINTPLISAANLASMIGNAIAIVCLLLAVFLAHVGIQYDIEIHRITSGGAKIITLLGGLIAAGAVIFLTVLPLIVSSSRVGVPVAPIFSAVATIFIAGNVILASIAPSVFPTSVREYLAIAVGFWFFGVTGWIQFVSYVISLAMKPFAEGLEIIIVIAMAFWASGLTLSLIGGLVLTRRYSKEAGKATYTALEPSVQQ